MTVQKAIIRTSRVLNVAAIVAMVLFARCTPTPAPPATIDLSFLNPLTAGTAKWINYAPNHYEPGVLEPTEEQIRANLKQLYQEGYRGLITYTVTGTAGSIPRIAREVGFTVIGVGIWDIAGMQEIEAAIALKDDVDFYSAGNEGIFAARYTKEQLASAIQTLRARTGKAVTTSEPWNIWRDNSDLIAMVDFVAANAYGWWDGAHEPQQAVDLVVQHHGEITSLSGDKTVIVRETGFPSAGHPDAGIAKQRCYFQLLENTTVPFVHFEAYDQPWKHELDASFDVGPHWGLHDTDGNLKQNHAPVAADQSLSTATDAPVAVTIAATDPDGDDLTYSIVSAPANGTVTGTAPNLIYTPNAGFAGQDEFTFRAGDCELESNLATVTIAVEADATPAIEFTFVPPLGSLQDLTGITRNVDRSTHRVVVYINVAGTWWVKPTFAEPLTPIEADGTWSCDITTGGQDQDATEIRAYVVSAGYAAQGNSLPAAADIIASASATR